MAIAAAAAIASLGASFAQAGPPIDPNSPNFEMALIPDTQLYTTQASWDVSFTDQMNWIVANSTAQNNIVYTLGLGDLVQDGVPLGPQSNTETFDQLMAGAPNGNVATSQSDTRAGGTAGHLSAITIQTLIGVASTDNGPFTPQQYMTEWTRADQAYGILDKAGVPYYAVEGRHDYWHWGNHNTPQAYLHYFGADSPRYLNKGIHGSPAVTTGTYLQNPGLHTAGSTGPSDMTNAGLDAYSIFRAGGYNFLQISLQFDPDASDFQWAKGIMQAHPGIPTIINTADAMATGTQFNTNAHRDVSGQFIWDNFLKTTGNEQIFMLLASHNDLTAHSQPLDNSGDSVTQILTDYESDSNNGGGGIMRTLKFDLSADTVQATTFSTNPSFASPTGGTGDLATNFTLSLNTGAQTFQQRFGQPSLLNGLTWDPKADGTGSGGAGTWDNSTANWFNGASDVPWDNSSTIFAGTGGAVNVAANVSATGLTFKVPGYTLGGTGTITLTGAATIDESGGQTVINNAILGSAGVTVTGGGTGNVTFGGNNTFTGGLTIQSNGNVLFSADTNLGATGGAVTIAGATLTYTGTTAPTINRPFTIGTGGANIDTVNAGATGKFAVTGVFSGAGNMVKSGTGWLTLYGNNTTTGTWSVNAGVLEAGNTNALGTGAVTINSGGELGNNAPAPIANNITLNTGSTIGADYPAAGGTGAYSGAVNVAGNSTVRLGNFWSNLSQNVTISGNLTGSGSITTAPGAGATTSFGILTLSGNNSSYSGQINIAAGTVATTPGATKPLGTGAINMNGGTLLVDGQVSASGAAGSIAAVPNVSGFNKDVILGNPDTGGTTTGTMDGFYSFYQTGFTPTGGTALTTGGISGPSQVSATTNTVNTSVHTPFTLQSFTGNNTLSIAQNGTGTITLNAPTAYANLSVLATSTFGSATDANDVRNVTIHFADGTNVTTTYKAYDWGVGTDATRSGSNIFGTTTINRYSSTVTPAQDTHNFGMYESDIDLTNIGGVDYSFKPVQSLTFSAINDDAQGRSTTEIFGVSGAARGQASGGPVANYGNDVTVNANSTIDVGKDIQEAIMGNLTIVGSSVLTVTSDNTTASQPYTLAFASSSTSSSLNFNIQRSKGNGIGTVVLDTSTGQSLSSNASVAGAARTYPSISISGGALAFQPGGSPFNASSLTLSSTGSLNVTNNELIIHESAAAEASLRALLASAYHNGSWDGTGLTSSFAGGSTELGYASTGTSADPAILVKLASVGDTNLDGSISTSDIDNVLANYDPLHIKPQNWSQGDFNYDGYTDNQDLNQLMALYSPTSNSAITLGEFDQLQAAEASGVTGSAVPEPGSLSLLAIGATALLGRRKRREAVQTA